MSVPFCTKKEGELVKKSHELYPIHNHLKTELCTEKCPNYRANKARMRGIAKK